MTLQGSLFAAFVWLSYLDVKTTQAALTHFNLQEGNPLVNHLIHAYGLDVLLPIKAIGVLIIYALWRITYKNGEPTKTSTWIAGSITALMVAVIANNSYHIAARL